MMQYHAVPGFTRVDIFGDAYLVAGKEKRKSSAAISFLNEMAALIWDSISRGESPESIALAISDEYEVKYDQALQDVLSFCKDLCNKGFLLME